MPFYNQRRNISLLTILILFTTMLLLVSQSQAQLPTDVENTSIAINFDRIINDTGWGVLASAPIHVGKIDGYAAGILQSGNLLRGKFHAEAGTNIGTFGVRAITFGTVKGNELSELGSERNFGVAIDTPEVKGASIRIGIFGKNAGEFGSPNARDILEDNRFHPNDLDGLGLEGITAPPEGLKFKAGNSLNALFSILFSKYGISWSIQGMPELTGEGEPAHQAITSAHVSRDITDNIGIDLGAEIGIQSWNKTINHELAYFAALSLNF